MKINKMLLILGVSVVASLAFVGCSTGEETPQDAETTLATEEGAVTESEESEEVVEGETETEDEANANDGVYRVEYDQADEQGMKTFLEVTVIDGAIVNVNFDEVNTNDDEADNTLEQALLTAQTPEEFEQMIEGQPEAEAFKTFVAQIIGQIETGNKEVSVISK